MVRRGRAVLLGGEVGGAQALPKFYGSLHMPTRYDRADKFRTMIKLDERKVFTRSTMLPVLAKVCVTRILTRNLSLLAALNLLLKLIVTF